MNRPSSRITRRRFRPDAPGCNPFSDRILMFDIPMQSGRPVDVTPEIEECDEQLPSVAELRQLMNRDVTPRDEYLAELKNRLQNGEFLTRAAAEQSAQRMIDDGEFS
ncbi:MAG: hypothetical protein WAO83_03515 [Fuerstiella sp.]